MTEINSGVITRVILNGKQVFPKEDVSSRLEAIIDGIEDELTEIRA